MVQKTVIKLSLALIHNNDPKRLNSIKPDLTKLKKELSTNFDIDIFEVSEQPAIFQQNIFITLIRKCIYWKINREWKEYRLMKPRNILLDLVILFRRLLLTYLNQSKENKRSTIETFIVDKHIRAWEQFLKSKADLLICFEDDVVFKNDSLMHLKTFLLEICKEKKKPIYLDFAGGCPLDILDVKNLETKNDKWRKFYRKPVTNTACCYLINRSTASIFIENIIKYPWLRLICTDWLMNKFFILATPKTEFYCYHTYPHLFNHGSFTGNFETQLV